MKEVLIEDKGFERGYSFERGLERDLEGGLGRGSEGGLESSFEGGLES